MSVTAAELTELLNEYIGDIDPNTPRGQKRRTILEVATRMFAEFGYCKTSMDELAAEAGVAKGTLYLYFPKKIDLLYACGAFEKLSWVPELFGILEGEGPAEDRLKQWIVATLLLPSRSPLMCRLLEDTEMAALLSDSPPAARTKEEDVSMRLMQPMLDEIAGPGHRWSAIELRDRINVIRSLSYIAPILRHEALRPGTSIERFAAIFADLIVDGIRPRPPTPTPSQGEN